MDIRKIWTVKRGNRVQAVFMDEEAATEYGSDIDGVVIESKTFLTAGDAQAEAEALMLQALVTQ